MIIIAKAVRGQEFMYSARSAHKVSKASGQKIADCLNENRYKIDDNQVWWVYEIDEYDSAYDYAINQEFKVYKGKIKRCYRGW